MQRLLTRFTVTLSLSLLPALSGCGNSFFSNNTTTGDCGNFFHSPSCTSGDGGSSATNYVFVVNSGASTVSGLGISTAGALAALSGSPLSIPGGAPVAAAVTRANNFLYVGSATQIYGYAISSTGALTTLNSGSALTSAYVADMQVSPDGKWLMVLDASGLAVDLFAIDTGTGALTAYGSVPFQLATGTVPYHLRFNPAGTVVAATMGLGGQILFSFNTSTGALTQISQTTAVNTTTADRGLAWDSTGNYLFVTRTGTSQGLVVEAVASNGLLSQVGSTYTTGNKPTNVAIDNAGKYVYTTNESDSTVSGFTIGASEALTVIAGSPFSSGVGATAIGMDSSGKWVLVAAIGGSPDLYLYGFDSSNPGRLYSVSSSATGTNANFVALSH